MGRSLLILAVSLLMMEVSNGLHLYSCTIVSDTCQIGSLTLTRYGGQSSESSNCGSNGSDQAYCVSFEDDVGTITLITVSTLHMTSTIQYGVGCSCYGSLITGDQVSSLPGSFTCHSGVNFEYVDKYQNVSCIQSI